MKRVGNLFDRIVEPENLRLAFWKASKGKRHRRAQREFAANLEYEIARMHNGLLSGDYEVGNYTMFKIYEPKERCICAASFSERVLHHAFMNVCDVWFERWLIYDTYACRKGKGQFKALERAKTFAYSNAWFLKADVRKFFDSISHKILKQILDSKIKDEKVIFWFNKIIDTYELDADKGLPIGNLTSQFFANLYLEPLDRFVKEKLRCKCYVRYMDDFLLFARTKDELLEARKKIKSFVEKDLMLELKGEPKINRMSLGVPFLGMKVFGNRILLSKQSIKRFLNKINHLEHLLKNDLIDYDEYQQRVTALTAFVEQADSLVWRQKVLN